MKSLGRVHALAAGMSASTFQELRAWQLARVFKLGIYALTEREPLASDFYLRDQLRNAAASAPSNISEGFGRFDPLDFARMVKIAKASLLECQNHLLDAVDRGYVAPAVCDEQVAKAGEVLSEIAGLLDYLQSPDAKRNAERIRQRRFEKRRVRVSKPPDEP
jgi:four helix bundle protein